MSILSIHYIFYLLLVLRHTGRLYHSATFLYRDFLHPRHTSGSGVISFGRPLLRRETPDAWRHNAIWEAVAGAPSLAEARPVDAVLHQPRLLLRRGHPHRLLRMLCCQPSKAEG